MAKQDSKFPVVHCTRCGGSGHYSFNLMDGTRCYGCGGDGFAYASKKVAALAAELGAFMQANQRPTGDKLAVGDTIWTTAQYGTRQPVADRRGSGRWEVITAIETTTESAGRSGVTVNGETVWTERFILRVTTEQGEYRVSENEIIRRAVEASFPGLAELKARVYAEAWASLNRKQRESLANAEAAMA